MLRRVTKDYGVKFGLLVLSILVSGLVGTVLPNIFTVTKGEQIIIYLSSFVACSFLELIYLYNQSLQIEKREQQLWEIQFRGDKELYDIRACHVQVIQDAKDENDLFVHHFEKEFRNLRKKIADVARKKELFIASDYFLNADNVLKVFKSEGTGIWRYVWIVEDVTEPLFKEPEWSQFIEMTAKMVADGRMKEIAAIIVLGKPEFRTSPRLVKLLDFFKTNAGINCRLITKDNYLTICERNSVTKGYDDFGLYDDQLLFIERYEGHQITGTFSKDPTQIEDYLHLFVSLWAATSITGENPSTQTTLVTVNELIDFDLNYDENQ